MYQTFRLYDPPLRKMYGGWTIKDALALCACACKSITCSQDSIYPFLDTCNRSLASAQKDLFVRVVRALLRNTRSSMSSFPKCGTVEHTTIVFPVQVQRQVSYIRHCITQTAAVPTRVICIACFPKRLQLHEFTSYIATVGMA